MHCFKENCEFVQLIDLHVSLLNKIGFSLSHSFNDNFINLIIKIKLSIKLKLSFINI